jgi:hypothetical protein
MIEYICPELRPVVGGRNSDVGFQSCIVTTKLMVMHLAKCQSVGTISTNEVCPAANDVTTMQIQSGDTIRIKPRCYVCTMDHVISADISEIIEFKIKTMDWAGEITDLFHYGNKEAIHQAVQGLRTRYNSEFDATILLDQLDQLHTPDLHWAFTSPATMIGSAICIFCNGPLPLEMLLPD